VVLWQLEQTDAALQSLDTALQIDAKSYQARVNQGLILLALGRYEAAAQAYQQATHLNPAGTEAWYGQGTALLKLNREDEAAVAFAQASTANSLVGLPASAIAPTDRPNAPASLEQSQIY
jgi:tetratricopeptide (TPR) repeat protein